MIILADDLSGAMDAGMQLKGRRVRVVWGGFNESGGDVIVAVTDSRNIGANEAYKRLAALFGRHDAAYKKIDSTLRGNVGAEIKAAVDSGRYDCVVVAPALPSNGRTTLNGVHYVNGVPLAETELASDPFAPVSSSVIADIIRNGYDGEIGSLSIGESHLNAGRARVVVCDCETEADLRHIADLISKSKLKILPVGSAGLMRYIIDPPKPKPILIINGSPASASKRQIKRFVEAYRHISHFSGVNDADEIHETLKNGSSAVWDLAGESKAALRGKYDDKGLRQSSYEIQNAAAMLVEGSAGLIGALVVFGGDTALAVFGRLGDEIGIVAEILPYIPLGKLKDLRVVTKAGGFGDDDALVKIYEYLEGNDV
jgi:uncharacterized protein YgbK (DUF1537 family)